MTDSSSQDIHYKAYGSQYSLFSNKLECYLRYKGISYDMIPPTPAVFARVLENTGFSKVPAAETPEGDWLYDTTPMLQWFDQQHPQAPILPKDPALRFLALLLEDYGDEWLWRSALWWRWMPKGSRLATGWLLMSEAKMPYLLRRPMGYLFGRRQRKVWLWDDGMTRENSDAIRDMLYPELDFMEALFEQQPFFLGSHPSAADYGYIGAFLNHFCHDPDSLQAMRLHGAGATEWVARMWNARHERLPAEPEWVWPEADYWQPLLERIAKDYLPYLHQNALAFRDNKKRFNYAGRQLTLNNTHTTNYRVYCRQVLQEEFQQLSDSDQQRVERLFAHCGGLEALHRDGVIDSGLSERYQLPRKPSQKSPRVGINTLIGQPRN